MATSTILTSDLLLDVAAVASYSPLDADLQRGRKRRRNPAEGLRAGDLRSRESSTLRGRCRHRSTSRLDPSTSRATSRVRGGSISPSRRKYLRVIHLNRHRSHSPSRSRSPHAAGHDGRSRRRQRSSSRIPDYGTETPRSIPIISVDGLTSGVNNPAEDWALVDPEQ